MEITRTPEAAMRLGQGDKLEREELEWLLTSGVLGRAASLVRVLTYVCEEHFRGRADQIKEYSIAVEALGRRPDFDPQTDTIVRVTVHALRKRLLEIYQNEGAARALKLVIPAGRYAPFFIARNSAAASVEVAGSAPVLAETQARDEAVTAPASSRSGRHWRFWTAVGLAAALVAMAAWIGRRELVKTQPTVRYDHTRPAAASVIRALMGAPERTYVDHSGNTWETGNFCQGGTDVFSPSQRIQGTEDAPLYQGGVRGIAHCIFPVKPGLHELHFYFAETSDLAVATHVATLSINAGPSVSIDVVDNAGGDGMATSTLITGIAREIDGTIHVDFTSEVSALNAVEILPAPSAKQLPVRIVASSKPFLDASGEMWQSDRFFAGGRPAQTPESAGQASLGIFASGRIGRFRYTIPAVPLARYRLKLYFREPWFGGENGGAGRRVFDVACNGVSLMKNFDILAEGDSQPIIRTFENVQATSTGRIELYFMPVDNYAIVNAIELVAY